MSRTDDASTRPRRLWPAVFGAALAGALLASAALVLGASAHIGGRHGVFRHGGGHGPEAMQEHARHGTRMLLRLVDADAAQEAQAEAIVSTAALDLGGVGERHQAMRERWTELLTADAVDRAALEELRAAEMSLADEASQRLITALADLADVLRPDQRAELLELARDHHGH